MSAKDFYRPVSKRFYIHRVRKNVYYIVDTTRMVECRVSDPEPFRESRKVVLKPNHRDEVDLFELTTALLMSIDD